MAKSFRYQHLRSANTGAKPSSSVIREGEIAVNLADEKLFLKNVNGEVVDFISEAKIDEKISSQSGSESVKINVVSGAVDTVSGAVDTLSSSTDTKINNLSGAVDTKVSNDIKDFFDGAEYDNNSKRINFKHGSTVKAYIDASDFIKDGMISDVEIKDVGGLTCLVITFNADAGKQDINIPIAQIFDATNYYTKAEIDAALSGKVSSLVYNTYTAATDDAIALKANAADVYTKGQTYTKTEVSNLLDGKTDSAITDALNAVVTGHTANTDIHVTTSDKSTWNAKQAALVSGTNIKSVAGKTILGSGNLEISVTDLSTNSDYDVTTDGDAIILDAGTF